MPYDIKRNYGDCSGYAVVGPNGAKGCHPSRKKAIEQQRALYAAESNSKKMEHNNVVINENTPNKKPHSMEECVDKENCPDHMDKASPCWDGYVQRGMKPGKDGRMVPNCVPAKKYIADQIRPLF